MKLSDMLSGMKPNVHIEKTEEGDFEVKIVTSPGIYVAFFTDNIEVTSAIGENYYLDDLLEGM